MVSLQAKKKERKETPLLHGFMKIHAVIEVQHQPV